MAKVSVRLTKSRHMPGGAVLSAGSVIEVEAEVAQTLIKRNRAEAIVPGAPATSTGLFDPSKKPPRND